MRTFLILCMTFMLSLASPVMAQNDASTQDAAAQDTADTPVEEVQQISQESLESLIETLESEETRQSFLENLRTLAQLDDTAEAARSNFTSIIELLGLDMRFADLQSQYETFLERNNISSSLFGNLTATLIIVLVALIFMYINYRLSIRIRDKLISLKNRYDLSHERLHTYTRVLRYIGYLIIVLIAALMIASNWGLDPQNSEILALINFQTIFSIILVVVIGLIVWEFIDGAIEYMQVHAPLEKQARMNTLAPIIRNIALVVFLVIFTMILLSELGINVVPLLAGAGILGIAVGFGAQTMVKDYISGFFIIFEDLIQVGDVVTVAGNTGSVERLTIRKIQLRDFEGSVYTIPYSEVTQVKNLTKDFSYYVLNVGVAYREDIDQVIEAMKQVDEDLRAIEEYNQEILEPIEIVGLDQFADSAIVIKARIKTKPVKQWFVGRGYNRLLKYKFDEMNIEIPFPHQTIYFGENKDGSAPPMPIKKIEDKS